MKRTFTTCALLILAGIPSAQPVDVVNDSVMWTPVSPTSRDSIHFTLLDASACCCRNYSGEWSGVQDTTITLGFVYSDSMCALCKCVSGAGKTVGFPALQLAAGTYTIYKAAQIFCLACGIASSGAMLAPVRVGQITVKGAASAARPGLSGPVRDRPRITASRSQRTVTLRIDRSQMVRLDVFDPSGAQESRLHVMRRLDAGAHAFPLDNVSTRQGAVLVRVIGEDFTETRVLSLVE